MIAKSIDIDMASETNSDNEKASLIKCAEEWGYFRGSIKSRTDLWKGRRLLDVGMGAGPHSVSFIEGGALSYVGVDPFVGSDHVRDFRNMQDPSLPGYHAFPYSTDQIMEIHDNVHLYSDFLENVGDEVKNHKVDMAMMAAVTEHLQRPDEVFKTIWEILSKDGLLWYSHCNYYSWSGHHRRPRNPKQWDHNDPEHEKVVQWRHLEPDHPDYNNDNFNRVRICDLRDLTHKYFEILEWSVSVEGYELLTPDLRYKYRKYTLEELYGQNIYVTGRRRDVPLDMDLSDRQFFHPAEDYMAANEYFDEDRNLWDLMGSVYFGKNNMLNSHSNNSNAGSRLFNTLTSGDKLRVTKFVESMELTVDQVIRPKGGLVRISFKEDVPDDLIENNYDQWQVKRV